MDFDRRRRRSRGLLPFLLVLALPLGVLAAIGAGRETPEPEIRVTSDRTVIGPRGEVTIEVREPLRGLTRVTVELVQGERKRLLESKTFPAIEPWRWQKGETEYRHQSAVGKDAIADLQEGEAVVRVTAAGQGNWIRAPRIAERTLTFDVRLTPPSIVRTAKFIYVKQGGCEVVTYEVGATSVRDGVSIAEWFFPGYPVPGGEPNERFALFAVPYDLDNASDLKLIAEDEVGNRNELRAFQDKMTPRPMGKDQIALSDRFLEKVTTEVYSRTDGLPQKETSIEKYLVLNGELRKANNQFLRELAKKTRHEFLWRTTFIQMPNTVVKGWFADRRTYRHAGQTVDTQDHLGFDLASTEHAPISASNSGVVVFADYLGIYGNAVVVDHGFGLMSLYAHLSKIDVQEGQEVAQGESLGRSGATGLAGGDHLHFTMLLQGLAVMPMEWWDAHWIRDRLKSKLGAAMPWSEDDRDRKGG
jgi:murein DD-endopeptidase MepM/ murein hydrolase activator NlpD